MRTQTAGGTRDPLQDSLHLQPPSTLMQYVCINKNVHNLFFVF